MEEILRMLNIDLSTQFIQHDFKVGDKVLIAGVERHPFASNYFNNGDVATVIDATEFEGMPCVELEPNKGLVENAEGNSYGGDYGGVPFAMHDLQILTKTGEAL